MLRPRAYYQLILLCLAVSSAMPARGDQTFDFGVINQRTLSLTAQYWNPILSYVSAKSGVPLQLSMGKTAPDTTAMTVRGEHEFVYTNHMFTTERDTLGYRVILRMRGEDINAAIIVRQDSPITTIAELAGKVVVFPSREAFVGYWVPMDHLLKQEIEVQKAFAGNQEGAMARIQIGDGHAAAVNKQVLEKFARRENFVYRVLWESEAYRNIPIMASPKVPEQKIEAVRTAFIGMNKDPEGAAVLKASAELVKQNEPIEFLRADDRDYENYRRFYRETVVKPQ